MKLYIIGLLGSLISCSTGPHIKDQNSFNEYVLNITVMNDDVNKIRDVCGHAADIEELYNDHAYQGTEKLRISFQNMNDGELKMMIDNIKKLAVATE